MNTTVNELKAYYVKNGGSAADVVGIDTIPDMIAKITAISGGGGGGGSVGVLYALDAEPAQTDPALEQFIEEHPGVELTNDAFPVSTMPDGAPMDYAALVEFSNAYNVVIIRVPSEKMDDLVLQYYQTDGVEEIEGTYALGVKYISSFGTQYGVWFSNAF